MPEKKSKRLSDKYLYDIGMKAGKIAGDKAVAAGIANGILNDKILMGLRFKARDKAHNAAVEREKKRYSSK
jgi:hypothetical protein